MTIINTNITSLNAQRNLISSQTSLAQSVQRLSSGLRINSAKDDAAGLAISERFTTQIRGLNQAIRNANDGISLSQTAEGALGSITNNLQRIRELAVQSRNATNSTADRAALQKEVSQLKSEIDRVADQTSFNGLKLLDGSFTQQAFQVGADQGQTIAITGIVDANITALGAWTSVPTPSVDVPGVAPVAPGGSAEVPATPATLALGALTDSVGGDGTSRLTATFTAGTDTFDVVVTGAVTAASLAAAYVTAGFFADGTGTVDGFELDLGAAGTIEAAITAGSLTVTRADGVDFTYAEVESGLAYGTSGGFNAAPAASVDGVELVPAVPGSFADVNFQINGTSISVTATADATAQVEAVRAAINAQTSTTGVAATIVSGALNLSSVGGTGNINVAAGSSDAAAILANTGLTVADSLATPGTAQTGFSTLDISTTTGADNAILAMDAALNAINDARADLGAIQNRFITTVANLSVTAENLTASRSRILDADFAAETANLSRAQILQQAGVAMVAQANQVPQGVLQLLRG